MSKLLLPLVILVYTAFNSRELLEAWMHAPLDWLGWLPYLIWLAPLFIVRGQRFSPFFLWIAVISSILGNMASLNALRYVGLSSAIAAWAPFSWGTLMWWLGSIAWMPAFGWLGSRYFPEYLFAGRFLLVGMGVACLLIANRGNSRPPKNYSHI